MYAIDGNGNGDAKVVPTGPLKRRKSESAKRKTCTKRTNEPSRKKKGVRVKETTKMPSIDEPIQGKCP